jgi:ribosomal protein L11
MLSYVKNKTSIAKKLIIYVPSQNLQALSTINAILGQNGINVFEFTKQYNLNSKIYLNDIVLRLEVLVFIDKKFELVFKTPSTSFMLYEEVLKKDSAVDFDFVSSSFEIGLSAVYKIAFFIKKITNSKKPIGSIFKTILGSIKSTKIKVLKDL